MVCGECRSGSVCVRVCVVEDHACVFERGDLSAIYSLGFWKWCAQAQFYSRNGTRNEKKSRKFTPEAEHEHAKNWDTIWPHDRFCSSLAPSGKASRAHGPKKNWTRKKNRRARTPKKIDTGKSKIAQLRIRWTQPGGARPLFLVLRTGGWLFVGVADGVEVRVLSEAINQWMDQARNQSMKQSINESTNQSIN